MTLAWLTDKSVLLLAFFTSVLAFILLSPAPSWAQSCVANSDGGAMEEDENGDPAHRVYVYVESDMHGNGVNEMREWTTTFDDDYLTQKQLLASVASMIEIWNSTTRSVALVLAGVTTADSASDFCNAVSKRPAIYLHFDQTVSGTGAHWNYPLDDCEDEELAEIYFRRGNPTMPMGSQAEGTSSGNFETILIHELGHAVGLGDLGSCSTHSGVHSVMNGCPGAPTSANGRWFPLTWDKDCADAFSWGRAVNYRWRGFTSAGGNGLTEIGTVSYGRATRSGGYVRTSGGGARYALYGDDRFRSGAMGSDGNINWPTTSYMDATELSRGIGGLDVTPLFLSLHEETASSDPMRIVFSDDEDDASPSVKYNPPIIQSVETDAVLGPVAGNDNSLRRCTNAGCTTATTVRTHVPLATTWDPLEEKSVVAWVETYSEGAGADADGTMWIHAGFDSHDVLNVGTELDSSTLDVPSTSTAWTWMGKTLHSPAVTCSDGTYPFGTWNCIIAWVDRGLADAAGNTIAWTHFYVNSDGSFTFYPTSYTQADFEAGSSPAMAWFAGKFWLGFRAVKTGTPVVRVFTKDSGGDWDYHSYTTAADAVDSPTFIYRDGYESALVWTETE